MKTWTFLLSLVVLGMATVMGHSTERSPAVVKKQIRVFVIDTGIQPHKDLVKYLRVAKDPEDSVDNHGHGTHVAGIIAYGYRYDQKESDPLCEEVEIISCKYYDPKKPNGDNLRDTVKCLQKAIEMKPDYLNYSGGGVEFSKEEYELYKKLGKNGTISVVAAGNESSDLTKASYYPASYSLSMDVENMIVVSSVDPSRRLIPSSNFHPKALKFFGQNIFSTLPHDMYGFMTGTSQAAPGALHTILRQRCEQLKAKK